MKPYLLRNDKIQHQQRLKLESWYAKQRGRRVTFKEILHDLMAVKIGQITKAEPLR